MLQIPEKLGMQSGVAVAIVWYTWATETFPIGGSRTRAGFDLRVFVRKLEQESFGEDFFQLGPRTTVCSGKRGSGNERPIAYLP